MICYKDKTWCVQSINGVCQNTMCHRFYTVEERDYNKNNIPLSVADFKTEVCGFKPTFNYRNI